MGNEARYGQLLVNRRSPYRESGAVMNIVEDGERCVWNGPFLCVELPDPLCPNDLF